MLTAEELGNHLESLGESSYDDSVLGRTWWWWCKDVKTKLTSSRNPT